MTDPGKPGVPRASGDTVNEDVRCVECDYNLRSLPLDSRCPECGTPIPFSMEDVPYASKPRVPGIVDTDIPCTRCGYALRSLSTHGNCPHCGAPVWFSILGNWLRVSDPEWLRSVRRGMGLWLWALVLPMVVGLVGGVAGALLAITGPKAQTMGCVIVGGAILGLAAYGLQVAAVFLITTQEPALARTEDPVTLRRALRVLIVVSLAGSCVSTAGLAAAVARDPLQFTGKVSVAASPVPVTTQPTTAPATPVAPASPPPTARMGFGAMPIWVTVWGTVCGMIALAGQVGLFAYLRRLARRVPARKLERSTTIVLWGYALGVGLSALSSAAMNIAAATGDNTMFTGARPGIAVSCFAGLMGLGSLVFTIWLIVLLVQYRKALARAIDTIRVETAAG